MGDRVRTGRGTFWDMKGNVRFLEEGSLSEFFFLRRISPELTSAANPPLFAEEDWP